MKRLYFIILVLLAVSVESYGQGKVVIGQYFQNLPAFSPALTGANDYLDIRTGYRKQWAGFDGAPTTAFLSLYSPIRLKKNPYKANSLRTSSNAQYYKGGDINNNDSGKGGTRLGIGGYVLLDDQGPFQELESMLSFAVHIPLSKNKYISLGASGGLLNSSIDLDEITVVDDINDQTFLSYQNNGASNTFFNFNAGVALHSDAFYISYSAMQLTRTFLSGNEAVNNEGASIRHHLIGGIRLYFHEKWEVIPNTFIRSEANQPLFYEAGVRLRYNQNLWFGASYRNDASAVGMLGFAFSDKVNFGYAYEFKSSDFDNFNNGSHEIILGFRLFNFNNYTSIW
ncbi:MAG: type IX secretion system membrane protein PorP/SprF [Bacteroidota bacterium]